ncbi:hypothetical protein [Nesterenkonia alba]|uniref:hypothetical protein n=1 Tax=Nesterenkonia alba TaxID=515814 RepID=UPI0003B6777B|nr:hypothetical protein [Nesterenkonia alba]
MTKPVRRPAEDPRVLFNGTIHSTAEPYAEAMVVENDQIAWLGSDETAARLQEDRMAVHDLQGALVTPPFVGWITEDAVDDVGSAVGLTERLDAAAASGYGTVRLEVRFAAEAMHTEDVAPESLMVACYRRGRDHPVDVYPVVSLQGITDPAGAEGLKPLNILLSLLSDEAALWEESAPGRPVAVGLKYTEVAGNLIGVRTWMAEESRQLLLDVSDADPAAVVEDIVATGEQLRQLRLSPGPATPTVLMNFDSADRGHWEALLNTGVHVVARRQVHMATALSVGVPVSVAPVEGENPWGLVSAHAQAAEDAVSVRAAFNAQSRGAFRSLPERQSPGGQLNPGGSAAYVVWEADALGVQSPNETVAAWSTDTRARTPLLPYLEGDDLPRWKMTALAGVEWAASSAVAE